MQKNDMILLPNGTYLEREYENAIVMAKDYEMRYNEFIFTDTRESVVLIYIIMNMNENNVLVCSLNDISKGLKEKGANYSLTSISRAVKLLKEKYNDLVFVSKFHGISKFTIDKNKCFKA